MVFAVLMLGLFLPRAGAWGPMGHRTIAEIAETKLTPEAQAFVADLLTGESMGDVASWADSMAHNERFAGSLWYHFEKIPDGGNYLDNLRTLPDWQIRKGGVVAAILVANATLRDGRASKTARRDALKFLIHLTGDVHQPLHTGRPADKGGVSIKLNWFGTRMSLHRVWDSGLIQTGHRDLFPAGMSKRRCSRVYADYLAKEFGRRTFATEMDVEGWLNESLSIRTYAYEPVYLKDPKRYQSRQLERIDGRIYVAGLRLARMLNDIAAHKPVPARETALWKNIDSIVGDPGEIIRLQPRKMDTRP